MAAGLGPKVQNSNEFMGDGSKVLTPPELSELRELGTLDDFAMSEGKEQSERERQRGRRGAATSAADESRPGRPPGHHPMRESWRRARGRLPRRWPPWPLQPSLRRQLQPRPPPPTSTQLTICSFMQRHRGRSNPRQSCTRGHIAIHSRRCHCLLV